MVVHTYIINIVMKMKNRNFFFCSFSFHLKSLSFHREMKRIYLFIIVIVITIIIIKNVLVKVPSGWKLWNKNKEQEKEKKTDLDIVKNRRKLSWTMDSSVCSSSEYCTHTHAPTVSWETTTKKVHWTEEYSLYVFFLSLIIMVMMMMMTKN